VIKVVFLSGFHLKMHQNNGFFLIFLKLFLISAYKTNPKIFFKKLILRKKISYFVETPVKTKHQRGL
jgi:hypothetical protein